MKRLVWLVVPSLASAGGFEVNQQTAVSAGTGNAGVARDDDPGAAWHDPAALADGKGLRVDLSLIFARPSIEARALDGAWTESNEGAWATPPHLDVSYARDRWAAGVSLGVPFGSGITWPGDWAGQYEVVKTQLQVFRAAPFFAWSFGKLRASAGVHADFARLQVQRDLDFIDMEGDVAIDMDGRGFGVDAALFYRARRELAFGLAYRSRTSISLDGGADFTAPDAFANKIPDQDASSKLVLPDQLVVGSRYDFGTYAALLDVQLTMWSTHDKTTIDFAFANTPDVMQPNNWDNAWSVRTGGEWTAGKALVLRHGLYYDQTPAPTDRLAPSSPDSSRIGLTGGASWRFDRTWSADAFVESMWILRRDTANEDALQASYGGRAFLAGLGVRWTPGE
jgi:long-chain fatty acid transport protein